MRTNGNLPAYRSELPVAVDAMGGDAGFEVQVEGAIAAYKEFGSRSILVGPEEQLRAKLGSLGASHLPIGVRHAADTIGMEESPTRAVVRKPNSSLCEAYRLVEAGEASSIISTGNSGAMMAAGIMICGTMPAIKRPAIATLMPVAGDSLPNVVLDVGANVECQAHNLVQFATMGAIYFNCLFDVEKPPVALLSNGTEDTKGTDAMRAAAMVLSRLENINYIGYVEGRDIPRDRAKVIVCDGLVGNIVLKAMEGAVRLIFDQIMYEGKKGLLRKVGLGLSRGTFHDVFLGQFDYSSHGGAPLLGLKKVAIVLHGASGSRAVKNAIRVADNFVVSGMIEKIAKEIGQLEDSQLQPFDNIFSGVMADGEGFSGAAKRAKVTTRLEEELPTEKDKGEESESSQKMTSGTEDAELKIG
ncbi:MAG: phosphate acyltransferase PlsX [Deltaproteobacteria bacterium]|nr:phosphate acyltransferase PlsX [Deltaproteobacteria bacterium]